MTLSNNSTYGVDNLKQVITFLGAQIQAAFKIDADGDGKTSTAELFQYALGLISTVPGILPSFQLIDEEVKDLTSEEMDELTAHILRTDFLPDEKDRAEHYVKALIFMLNVNRQFVQFSVKYFAGEDVRFDPLQGLI